MTSSCVVTRNNNPILLHSAKSWQLIKDLDQVNSICFFPVLNWFAVSEMKAVFPNSEIPIIKKRRSWDRYYADKTLKEPSYLYNDNHDYTLNRASLYWNVPWGLLYINRSFPTQTVSRWRDDDETLSSFIKVWWNLQAPVVSQHKGQIM